MILPNTTTANGIKVGDFVTSSRYGHTGRVYEFVKLTDEDYGWISRLKIPLTRKQIQQPMVGILIHGGGAVSVPADTCTIIPKIEDFEHPYSKKHFPTG